MPALPLSHSLQLALALALALAGLAAPSALAAQTWTVDDDGPADFAEISDAIDAVAAGDVLLVEPGTYASFLLDKPLTILGRAGGERPHVREDVRILAETFTLAGFDLDRLRINGCSGRGRVDDCRVNLVEDLVQQYAIAVDGSAELVISRTRAKGSYEYSYGHTSFGGAAMSIRTSNVTLVDCLLEGAQGKIASLSKGTEPGKGGIGLHVEDGASVLAAGCDIIGGWEGWDDGFLGCNDSTSGAGVVITGSFLVLRGSDGDYLSSGFADTLCGYAKGYDIDATGSTVVISGVDYDPANVKFTGSTFKKPAVPEPCAKITGTDAPGGVRTLELRGPANEVALVAASLVPALVPLGLFEGKAWLDPASLLILVPVPMTGQNTPVLVSWTLPASTAGLEGLAIEVQPFFPGMSGALNPSLALAGNVAELIVRF